MIGETRKFDNLWCSKQSFKSLNRTLETTHFDKQELTKTSENVLDLQGVFGSNVFRFKARSLFKAEHFLGKMCNKLQFPLLEKSVYFSRQTSVSGISISVDREAGLHRH